MPKVPVQYDEQIVIRLESKTKQKLERRAAKEKRKPSAMARIILERALLKN